VDLTVITDTTPPEGEVARPEPVWLPVRPDDGERTPEPDEETKDDPGTEPETGPPVLVPPGSAGAEAPDSVVPDDQAAGNRPLTRSGRRA
jgi:hypothetical protein